MTVDTRQTLGRLGEGLACRELERRGYRILARRFRTRFGEIDVVAREGPTIVFVEVKARRGGAFGGGAVAVTPGKQRRITRLAEEYLLRARLRDVPVRFDVVVVDLAAGAPAVEVYPNAFGLPER